MTLTIEDIRAARERIGKQAVYTPLLSSPFLDEIAGRKVFVKAECLQRTGSFKFRGGWSAVSGITDEKRKKGVIAFSSGNHAQGVALAAKAHGSSAVIIMPSDAPKVKIENTRAYGAEVVLYDRVHEDRNAIGAQLSQERGLTLIKPYDEPLVIAGQGTIGLEIEEQSEELGIAEAEVLVPCGGGGMTSGIAIALDASRVKFTVRPCEPEGFDDTARSLLAGRIQSNAKASGSICDAIVTPQPGEITFPIMKQFCGSCLVVTDEEALRAVVLAFQHLHIVVEPGGAVALASALFRKDDIHSDAVIVVASGGNIDTNVMADALRRFG